MSYVQNILQPGEKLLLTGRVHWIGFWRALVCFALTFTLLLFQPSPPGFRLVFEAASIFLGGLGLAFGIRVAFVRWGTEIAVTDRRVIYKRGVIARHTAEINMDKVETVLVEQSLLGRLLNYGAVSIRGSGASIETLRNIAHPIALRSAITAR